MINKQILQRTFILLAALALVIPMLSCSDKKPRVNRSAAAGDETGVEEGSKDVVVGQNNQNPTNSTTGNATNTNSGPSSPETLKNVFEGTWEVDNNGIFTEWNFNYASKKDDKLEGKITDSSNKVVGNYTVFPNETVELIAGSTNFISPYKISNGGNQIEVSNGTTKIILTYGRTNTTIQTDVNILASRVWININAGPDSDEFEFSSVKKSSSGWNGSVTITDRAGPTSGTFSLTPGKLTTTINGSVDVYSYKFRDDNTTLDLTDSSGKTQTYK